MFSGIFLNQGRSEDLGRILNGEALSFFPPPLEPPQP